MNQEFQTIQSLGRDALIAEIRNRDKTRNKQIPPQTNDGAAVITQAAGATGLVSSSTFVEGVHFDLTYNPLKHLGYKIVASSISNILAMNGKPESVLINLAVPNRQSVQSVYELFDGIYTAGDEYNLDVAGIDLVPNHHNMVVGITVYGTAATAKIIYRNGSKLGDAVCISGDVGSSLAGLRILTREKRYWNEHGNEQIQPDLQDYEYVVKRQLLPQARMDAIQVMEKLGVKPSSMTDVKQSLWQGAKNLAAASGLGIYLYQAAIPVALETRQVADEMQEDVDRYALFGGEDLELLFTLDEKSVEKLAAGFKDFTVIGRMIPAEDGLLMQTAEGEVVTFDDMS